MLTRGTVLGAGVALAVSLVALGIGYRFATNPAERADLKDRARVAAQEAMVKRLAQQVRSLQSEIALSRAAPAQLSDEPWDSPVIQASADTAEQQEQQPLSEEDLLRRAEQADEAQAQQESHRREEYLEVAESMDLRRRRQPADVVGFQDAQAALRAAEIPLRDNAAGDGCGTSICSFTLAFEGRVEALTDTIQATVSALNTERTNWALLRLPSEDVRLFMFSKHVTLRDTETMKHGKAGRDVR